MTSINKDTKASIIGTSPLLNASIIGISPYISKKSDNFTIKLQIKESNELVHGQYAKILLTYNRHKGNVIPQKAMMYDDNGAFIYIVDKDNKIEKKYIKTAIRLNDDIEVMSGIDEEDKIIVQGMQSIHKGSDVSIID
jgi:HlyD family secretion protein